jgi:hypothetical protein
MLLDNHLEDVSPLPLKPESHDESNLPRHLLQVRGIRDSRYSHFLRFLYYVHWVVCEARVGVNNIHKLDYPLTEPVSGEGKGSKTHIRHRSVEENFHRFLALIWAMDLRFVV